MNKNMKITGVLVLVILIGTIAAAFFSANMDSNNASGVNETSDINNELGEDMIQGTQLENYETREQVAELESIDIVEGDGGVVPEGATITANYTGALAETGVIFQSSKDFGEPVQFGLNQVIPGWTEGVPGMKEGGTRRLIIPAELAYGSNPPQGSGIPPSAPLVFDIEVVSID